MWEVTNQTPLSARGSWGRNKDGVHEWLVAVKGVFDIRPGGRTALAEKQLEPLLLPEYHGADGFSSLRYDADLLGPKPTTDVVFNATAHAPGSREAAEFLISFRLGSIEKGLRVVGDRERGSRGSSRRMASVPVRYELAYGGSDTTDPDPRRWRIDLRNPVGRGVSPRPERSSDLMPNFEHVQGALEKAGPAGLGPVASHWSPRRERSGTYDECWQRSRAPLLPIDWDPRSLLCAPVDQQAQGYLKGGEPVELVNLSPGGALRFTLPTVDLRFKTQIGQKKYEHPGNLVTVLLEPDHPRVCMTWLACLPCITSIDYLEETVISMVGTLP